VRDYLRMIQEEAFRCKRITEKLLDFSRTSELRRAPTELNALVTDVVEMVRHLGKYRGKSIEVKSTEAVYALADAQEIKQVALNLVVNALDSVDPGGWLVITLRYAEGMAEMEFVDNGKGMTPEVLENIFEPFFTTRPVGKGTGLGLSITHRIISQHDGLIFAESDGPDRGARFVVRLPVAPGVFDADSDSRIRAIAGPSDEGPDPSRGKVFHAA
jgi:two-component system NtrC family sensor kinase